MTVAKAYKSKAATPNPELIVKFLQALFPDELDAPNSFGWGGLTYANWSNVNADTFQSLGHDIAALSEQKDVYFHVCTHDQTKIGKRGKKVSALLLTAIYLDLDVHEKPGRKPQHNYATRAEAEKFLFKGGCPLKPSIVVESGSGGFHVYWLLREPIEPNDQLVKEWQKSCRDWLGYDIDLVYSAAHLMRIPGTIHHTHSTLVDISYFDDNLRYNPSDFEEYLKHVPKTSLKTSTGLKYTPSLKYTNDSKKDNDSDETILRRVGLERFIHEPTVMLTLARRVLGIAIKTYDFEEKGNYKKFCCILPGHEETEPSASLLWGEKNALIYQDFHGRENKRSYSLTVIFASLHYGRVKNNLSATEKATWLLRMLIAGGIIPPAKVHALPLPDNAPNSARRVYEGFISLLQCRGHYSPNTPAAFAWDFARAWCKIPSKATISEGLMWLKKHGYMVKAGEHSGFGRPMCLYKLGTHENVMKQASKMSLLKGRSR